MKKQKHLLVRNKSFKTNEEIAQFLHALASRVKEKKIRFAQGEEETDVDLPDQLAFRIKASETKHRKKGLCRKVTLQMKWYEGAGVHTPVEVR